MRILVGPLFALPLVACSQETDVDRCVDAATKVYDDRVASGGDTRGYTRDEFKAIMYQRCEHKG